MFLIKENKILKALGLSFVVLKHMHKAIELGPLTDAYFALSQYHYYKYHFALKLKWLPSNKMDHDLGYQYLQNVIDNGFFMKQEAKMCYISMRIIDRDLEGLEEIINERIASYPANQFYLNKALEYHLLKSNWNKMLEYAYNIFALLEKEPLAGASSYLRINYYLVLGNYKLGNTGRQRYIWKILTTSKKIYTAGKGIRTILKPLNPTAI